MPSIVNIEEPTKADRFAEIALDVGTLLMASGAHCGRVKVNIESLASTWDLEVDMNQLFKSMLVSVWEKGNSKHKTTSYRSSPPHSINFHILSDLSDLIGDVKKNKQTIEYFESKFAIIKQKKHAPILLIATALGTSCAGLTLIANGDFTNAIISFMSVFIGTMIRHFFIKKGFNHIAAIVIAAFTTTLITGLGYIFDYGAHPEAAIAMSVLYLIPGVPLLNSVIDLIDGYLSAAVQRAVFAGFIILAIAVGMTLCITLLGINNIS